jgi:hypothetical protein
MELEHLLRGLTVATVWTMTGAARRGIVEIRFGLHSGGFLCKILDLNFAEWVE